MLETFTPEARTVLGASLGHAVRLGHNYVGTEHILLGLLSTTHGDDVTALSTHVTSEACEAEIIRYLLGWVDDATALRHVGVDPKAVQDAFQDLGSSVRIPGLGAPLGIGGAPGWDRLTPRTVRILQAASVAGAGAATGRHILAAMLDEDSGLAVLVLERLGVLEDVRAALAA
jgi:ATP-dependent Clp protease ATP-binding subunit ClpA